MAGLSATAQDPALAAVQDVVEQWRPVPGLPGYEVSDAGHVRSRRLRSPEGRILQAEPGPCGFPTINPSPLVTLDGKTRRVGILVALAFIGPPPFEGAHVRHLNGDPLDDRLENLAWGTFEQVQADHAARARREEAAGAPTHCPEGHRYEDSWLQNFGSRDCRTCRNATGRTRDPRKIAVRNARRRARWRARAAERIYTCPDCGVPVDARRPQRCGACARAAELAAQYRYRQKHHPPVVRPSGCIDCGEFIEAPPRGARALRCPGCKRKAQRAADARHRARVAAAAGRILPAPIDEKTVEQARELTERIERLVAELEPLIAEAVYRQRPWAVLGYAGWEEYCDAELRGLRLPIDQRVLSTVVS